MTPSLPGIACAWAVGIVFAELGALPAPLALLTGAAALGTGIGVPALRAHAVLWTAVAGGALALAVDTLPSATCSASTANVVALP